MKTWYLSKTLWLNALAVVALVAQTRFGFILDIETQTGILAVLNLILRLVTGQPLDWGNQPANSDTPTGTGGYITLPLLFAMLLTLALFAGCVSTPPPVTGDQPGVTAPAPRTALQTAGKSLLAAKATIVTASAGINALCSSGTLQPAACSQAKTVYETSKPAYDTALDAYLLMSAGGGDAAGFGSALIRLQNIAANLLLISGGAK